MTAVARVLPRNWDGGRLLRFLAGLAMLALAFGSPVPAAPAITPTVTVSESASPAPVTVSESVAPDEDVRVIAVPRSAEELPATVVAAVPMRFSGLALRTRAERAPPVA